MLKKAYVKVMSGVFDYKSSGKANWAGNTDPSLWKYLIFYLNIGTCFEMDASCLKIRSSYTSLEISCVEIT